MRYAINSRTITLTKMPCNMQYKEISRADLHNVRHKGRIRNEVAIEVLTVYISLYEKFLIEEFNQSLESMITLKLLGILLNPLSNYL